ncbi:MAG: WD40/YVTN/BNR-like repeat-containing protein [Gemmatimonadales bacterium]
MTFQRLRQPSLALAGLFLAVPSIGAAQAVGATPTLQPVELDSTLLSGYRWRNIGPDRGGRSIAATGVRGRKQEAYFGAVGGGLWKTTDGGETWRPVTDDQITSASVGAVAVSESDPNVVFIGTGETCIRGNIMPGDGVYKSTDGGATWTHVGFRQSHGVSKIRIHPTNPSIVYVAVFGKYSAPSDERGVYKTTDGGRSWRRVLFRNDATAAIDLSIDPTDPNVVYASLWEAYRKEYQMSSGGPGSGLFKSTDGGETWTEITRRPGLPQRGVVGRIGVSVSGANPLRVYALVEHDSGGLFRSEDAGRTWAKINESRSIRQRAFYYTHVFADPGNADVVYIENTALFRSTDGGKTLDNVGRGTHGDFHDLWIDPDDPSHLVVGNDGGGAVSFDTAGKWTAQDYPTAQFYHVVTTAHVPYHVCGSQQDNSTLCVPFDWNAAAVGLGIGRRRGAARGADSTRDITAGAMAVAYVAGGGEPGYIAPDPRNPDLFYSGTNNGAYVDKFNRRLGISREVNPYPWFYSGEPAIDIRERWQWTFPILFSPVDRRTLYVSSQRLWATTDGGQTWRALSGDLTRHDPATLGKSGGPITGDMNGPEVYATIFAVGPGKRDINVIWTGSDDGLVHVTRDGGTTWTNVTPPDMPDFGRVSQIDASAFGSGAAYVSVRRPLLDDLAPYIWRTKDYGKTWTRIVSGIRSDAYVHAVREDPTRRGLLYAATQHGVYLSYDDGDRWQELNPDLPDLPIVDLIVEDNELVIASHGRGFWVLDNLAPLRQIEPATLSSRLTVFTPPTAVRSGPAVVLSWWQGRKADSVRLEILDSAGAVLRTYRQDTTSADSASTGGERAGRDRGGRYLPNVVGLNRLAWDLRGEGATTFPGMILWGARTDGPLLPPGRYAVRVVADGESARAPLVVRRNPWIEDVTDADLRAQYVFAARVRDKVSEANEAVIAIRRVKAQLEDRVERTDDATLERLASRLDADLSDVEGNIYQVRNQSNQDPLNFPIKVNNRLANLMTMAQRGDGRPTSNMPEIFRILSDELASYTGRLAELWRRNLKAVNAELERLSLPPLDPNCLEATGCPVGVSD